MYRGFSILLLMMCAGLALTACDRLSSREALATVFSVEGNVTAEHENSSASTAVNRTTRLATGDKIRTAENATLRVSFLPGILGQVESRSELRLLKLIVAKDGNAMTNAMRLREVRLQLVSGLLNAVVQESDAVGGTLIVDTPFGMVTAPAGSVFRIEAGDKRARILCVHGKLQLQAAGLEQSCSRPDFSRIGRPRPVLPGPPLMTLRCKATSSPLWMPGVNSYRFKIANVLPRHRGVAPFQKNHKKACSRYPLLYTRNPPPLLMKVHRSYRKLPQLFTIALSLVFAALMMATPSDEIARAVSMNGVSNAKQAKPDQFVKAFTAVVVSAKTKDIPSYVSSAIKLRPDLADRIVVAALKAARPVSDKDVVDKQLPCEWVEPIIKAAIAAAPNAKDAILRAAIAAEPEARDCIVEPPGEGPTTNAGNINRTGIGTINPGNIGNQGNVNSRSNLKAQAGKNDDRSGTFASDCIKRRHLLRFPLIPKFPPMASIKQRVVCFARRCWLRRFLLGSPRLLSRHSDCAGGRSSRNVCASCGRAKLRRRDQSWRQRCFRYAGSFSLHASTPGPRRLRRQH